MLYNPLVALLLYRDVLPCQHTLRLLGYNSGPLSLREVAGVFLILGRIPEDHIVNFAAA